MRLYLSSQNFGDHTNRLIEMVGENKSVLYIGNAKDDTETSYRDGKMRDHKEQFEALGFQFKELDLREYFNNSKLSPDVFKGIGLVWVSGGNVFLLRCAIQASGFDSLLLDGLSEDLFVYGGSSAGSVLMSSNLEGYSVDNERPEQTLKTSGKPPMFEAFGIIDFQFVPHLNTPWAADYVNRSIEYFEKNGVSYKGFEDGQVLVVDGDRIEFLL